MDLIVNWMNSYNKEINIDNYKDNFQLPIETIDDKILVNTNIIDDLELSNYKNKENKENKENLENQENQENQENKENLENLENQENQENKENQENLYYTLLNPTNIFEKNVAKQWCKYYTNNKEYLMETQDLLRSYKNDNSLSIISKQNDISGHIEDYVYESCNILFNDNAFIEKYQYIDFPILNKYNNNEFCLQGLSIYNLASPIISLMIPIIFLFLPFIIIKIQGYPITLESYIMHLKNVFRNHILGKFFLEFASSSITTKIYLLLSFAFYLFQIYQNIINCTKFYKNIKLILDNLYLLKQYISNTINKFDNLLKYTKNYINYQNFNKTIEYNKNILKNYLKLINNIKNYNYSFYKLFELGKLMMCFYKLHDDENLIGSLYYSFGFNGYINNLTNIQQLINNKNINFCVYNKKNSKTNFTNSYYCKLLENEKIVKNSYKLDNNLIITGPNAAGKTTLLKSTLFNTLLCQQIGCGFFDSANINIYDYIHCYINIPDTSNRDSLFQAEARRCKEILTCIQENKDNTHLCVFDEIYSGTNPDEAIKSAHGYLSYLNTMPNVNYVLTTHYHKLCKKLNKATNKNCHMEIIKNKDDFEFTYKIKKGISKIKGGVKVLKDLHYPDYIINKINEK